MTVRNDVMLERPVVRATTREGRIRLFGLGAAHVALIVFGLLMIAPLAWLFSSSLKPAGETFLWPPTLFPSYPKWANYGDLFEKTVYVLWMRNSIVISGLTILGSVLSSTLVGYSFARLRFPGRDQIFLVCLSTMMLPTIVTLIPSFIMFRYLGWIDSFAPLIVPAWFGSPFFIFLARQFFRTIPYEYDEAARVDGAGSFRIWWQVLMPMARPVVGTIIIFAFIWSWNDFLHPLIYLLQEQNLTLAVGLRSLQSLYARGGGITYIFTGSFLMTLPVLLVFFFAQRYFLQGIALTGLGGR